MTSATSAPAVSVLMPVRACRATLPMAVASVLAQTLSDWELLVVFDDELGVPAWLDNARDERIRVLRSAPPGGRGAARAAGLAHARGEYLAFLDADDWMLPDRLSRQRDVLDADPVLSLVSGGVYVVDRGDALFGVRRLAVATGVPREAPVTLLDSPVMNAASMMRTDRARAAGYRSDYPVGEDAEFLVRYLRGRMYLQEAVPVYCYREFLSFTRGGIRDALRAVHARYRLHARSRLQRARALGRWWVKRGAYEVAFRWPGEEWIVGRRSRDASPDEAARFAEGLQRVEQSLAHLREAC